MIDADALIEDIYVQSDDDGWFVVTALDLEELVNGQPTIEAVPERKKGRWLRYNALGEPDTGDTFYWQCDKCLKTEKGYMTAWAYCPNCGAHMEGAEE